VSRYGVAWNEYTEGKTRERVTRVTCHAVLMLQITVDGDTSTNDTVLALSSGQAGNSPITDASSAAGRKLQAALTATLQGMAKAIAWDGEGATCLFQIKCVGADSEADALLVAKSVAASSLTKAAMFGHDPNWGRIACAAGYSGSPQHLLVIRSRCPKLRAAQGVRCRSRG
jgi:glutamate N-acetyltransferase / amino-acid N-acetyltransferase